MPIPSLSRHYISGRDADGQAPRPQDHAQQRLPTLGRRYSATDALAPPPADPWPGFVVAALYSGFQLHRPVPLRPIINNPPGPSSANTICYLQRNRHSAPTYDGYDKFTTCRPLSARKTLSNDLPHPAWSLISRAVAAMEARVPHPGGSSASRSGRSSIPALYRRQPSPATDLSGGPVSGHETGRAATATYHWPGQRVPISVGPEARSPDIRAYVRLENWILCRAGHVRCPLPSALRAGSAVCGDGVAMAGGGAARHGGQVAASACSCATGSLSRRR